MSDPDNEAAFLATINMRLNLWRRAWNVFLIAYWLLGAGGVFCATVAASHLFEDPVRQVLSLASALCIALIGFLRPEARYRSFITAWCDLKWAQEHYLFEEGTRSELLNALRDAERTAAADIIAEPGQLRGSKDPRTPTAPTGNGSVGAKL